MKKINLGIVGVSGVVGSKILEVLEEYGLLFNNVRFFASSKNKGKIVKFQNKEIEIEELNEDSFKGLDIVLFATPNEISSKYCLIAEKEGAIVIDNSSAFRLDKDIPLIVPSINMDSFYSSKRRIIANPNCSTIQSVIVLNEINKANKINRIIYTTYQSISGAGKKAMDDYLFDKNEYFNLNIKKTCIPLIGDLLDNNYSSEELKMINETKKIFNDDSLKIHATCIRVPVLYCHGVSIYIECENKVNLEEIKKQLAMSQNIVIIDDNQLNLYPSSLIAKDNDLVFVGRIRNDLDNKYALSLYCVSDNLRIGAASNVCMILRNLILKDL